MKKKNVIYWIGVKNPIHSDKYGNFDYFDYSKNTWKHFCKKYDCEFVEFDTPVKEDLIEYRVNWQKILFVFDELDRKGIAYDQIALVDSTCMVRWDCPNFFELTDHKFVGWRDLDNMRWIKESIDGYQDLFNIELDGTKYINSGFIIFNDLHRNLINQFRDFYETNKEILIQKQDQTVKKGTEQTPLNYWLQKNGIEVKTDLPLPFKLTHLHRKQLFNYNWQLNEDKTLFFIKYGYNWIFNGIPKDQRSQVMKQIWDMVKQYYSDNVLDKVNHKDTYKNSTTRRFKQELLDFLTNWNANVKPIHTIVEFGCCQGDTTRVMAELGATVYASDIDNNNVQIAKQKCLDCKNVHLEVKDVNSEWTYETPDVIYLDALHDYHGIQTGLQRVKQQYPNTIIIMDDYGHEMNTVKPIVDSLEQQGEIEILTRIGEDKGFTAANGKSFVDKEGVIFKWK